MNKKQIITAIIHILVWALFLSIPILFFSNPQGEHAPPFHKDFFGLTEIISYLTFIGFFYLNAYVLIPVLLSKKKTIVYIATVVVLIILIASVNAAVSDFYKPHLHPRTFMRLFGFKLFPCIFNFAISTSYRIIIDNVEAAKTRKEKENENLKSELSFLRSQVSPHFMFNVLNNMVALARKKSDRLEPALIELSNLMRYMLYESGEEKVSVNKEIEYLKSYIDLQMLRFGDDVKVNFDAVRKTDTDNFIEPMLFIPLVENAFKHGMGLVENPEINIQLIINEESIFIRVINKFNSRETSGKTGNSGIGLSNLERRLNLLYPGKYELKLSNENNQFIAALNLNLK